MRGDSDDLSLDATLDLVADQRRRYALACLSDRSRAVSLAELAEEVLARESEGRTPECSREEALETRILLHHRHLPKLVEAGAVEYDQARDRVRLSDSSDRLEHLLSLAEAGGNER